MNFITGKNGSGKSTILTALSTCLGGKASATNRGNSLKSLIKEGKSSAKVIVTLHNDGINAYLPSTYGNEIRIERRLNSESAATFKVQNSKGKTVSTSARDVRTIMEHFSIHIDNPFAILTQDTARSFLASSSQNDKYMHLKRAMLMDKIELYNEETEENMDGMKRRLQAMKEDVQLKMKHKESCRKKANRYEEARVAYTQYKKLQGQIAWHQVKKAEDGISLQEQEVSDMTDALEKFKDDGQNFEAKKTELERRREELSKEIREIERSKYPITDKIAETEKTLKIHKQEEKTARTAVANHTKAIKECRSRIVNLEQEKQQVEAHDAQGERNMYQQEEQELKQELEQLKQQSERKSEEYNTAYENVQNAKDDNHRLQNKVYQAQERYKEISDKLNTWRNSKNERLSVYGEKFPSVIETLKKSTQFKETPLGPVGAYVSLKEKKWSSILETHLTSTLNAFVVFHSEDRGLLMSLLKRHGVKTQVILRSKDEFAIQSVTPRQYTTVLDVLEIKDDRVARALIDSNRIEATILVENREEGTRIMRQNPANVNSCISMQMRNRNDGTRIMSGGTSTTPIFGYREQPRMTQDTAEYIKRLQDDFRAAKKEVDEAKKETNAAIQRRSRLETEMWKLKRELDKSKAEEQEKESRLATVQEELSKDVDDDSELNHLNNAINEARLELSIEERQAAEKADEVFAASTKVRDVESEIADFKSKLDGLDGAKQNIENQVAKVGEDLNLLVQEHHDFQSNLKSKEDELARAQGLIGQMNTQRNALEKEAQEVWLERVEIPQDETEDSVQQEITRLDGIFSAVSQNAEDFTRVMDEAQTSEESYKLAFKEMKKYFTTYKKVATFQPERLKQQRRVLENTVSHIRQYFILNLRERGYNGTVEVDHENQKVVLKVATSNSKHTQDVNKLSGGEKSYSQVSLLASIWKAMDSKLLALDEFDVFMDKVNRKVSLQLVIKELRAMKETQSIFITPQELENTDLDFNSSDINVVRMDDPERAQVGQS